MLAHQLCLEGLEDLASRLTMRISGVLTYLLGFFVWKFPEIGGTPTAVPQLRNSWGFRGFIGGSRAVLIMASG